ncbi:MAG TPA: carbamoyltransferase C-terminal domain-containing protein, partial [Azospirillaceae bacterium]|nr:carbamoyltransferase C-terminal domain-containing protein [Azospirillaceae bacterium]
TLYDEMARHFSVDEQGRIDSDFPGWGAMRDFFHGLAEGREPADVAASVQKLLEVFVLGSVERLLARHPVRRLGLSGGVFANVRLNRLLAESLPVDEVFVFPAMGDEGLPVGGALDWLLRQDGLEHWLGRRYRLDDVYLGRDFGAQADALLGGHPGVVRLDGDPVATAVELLAAGQAGAIYTGRMEFGPRALGARTILASPAVREINDSLNKRLTRTEFMPFAPVVRAEDADAVFDLPPASRYAARFMTVTCGVKEEWRARIPAVVHVDGTARPQLVRRADNPLYHDILTGFGAATGLPVLVNTSFNVHEEPIVNSPAECLRALVEDRVDFVVTPAGVYRRA